MLYLVDSNVLLRFLQRNDPDHTTARTALRVLRLDGHQLCYTPQNIAEFWSVATRPAASRGGFGLTLQETDRRVRLIERFLTLLPDTPAIYAEWRRLVVTHSVSGVQVHDARLVAAMRVHGVTNLLTFNTEDFTRYPGITVFHPQDIK